MSLLDQKFFKLCVQLYSKLIQTSSSSTQTDQMFRETSCQTDKLSKDKSCQTSPRFDADTILNDISKYGLSNEDLEFLYHNIFHNLENKILALFVQIKSLENDEDNLFFEALGKEFTSTIFSCLEIDAGLLFERIKSLSMDEQIDLYSKLGKAFNSYLWRESNSPNYKDISILDLKNVKKDHMLSKLDKRIAAFFTSMTEKYHQRGGRNTKDNKAELSNLLDSLFKSRNSRYVSLAGLKEHLVAYISSNKNHHVSDLLSHIGGRGNRHLLETILDNSEIACKFEDPKKISVFVSFDNIQKLMKGHRLSEAEQQKVYGIIVTSILAVLPDGYQVDQIQYKAENNMTSWFSEFGYNKDEGIFHNQLDTELLKKMSKIDPEDMEIINKYWHQDLENELQFVLKALQFCSILL